MKRTIITIIAVLTVSQSLFGFTWGQKGRVKKLRKEVDAMAAEINNVFSKAKEIANELDKDFEELLASTPLENVDISEMDEENGGRYYFFQEKFYARRYAKEKHECTSFATGASPVGETEKRHLKLLSQMEEKLLTLVNNNSFISLTGFMTMHNASVLCPNFDVVATLPVGIDFTAFDWFQFYIDEARNDAKRLPSPLVTLATAGWIHGVGAGTYVGGESHGIIFVDVAIYKTSKALLNGKSSNIFIAFNDTTIINASASAKNELHLPALAPYDYLEQLKENPKLSEEIRLTHSGQPEGFRHLGSLITQGATEGEVTIDGETYQVAIASAPEGGYFVVGLTQ